MDVWELERGGAGTGRRRARACVCVTQLRERGAFVVKTYASLDAPRRPCDSVALLTGETGGLCVCRYFGNVCELDLIFNFHKAYFMLDELLLGGEQQETSKRSIHHVIQEQDALVENAKN